MNRLQSELHRLYGARSPAQRNGEVQPPSPPQSANTVRAIVLELTRPPSWEPLSKVWQGVQSELELPAPGIAVSGIDGLQLWFSLAEPVAPAQAQRFLELLRLRFLHGIAPERVRLMPGADTLAWPPAQQEQTGNWSAFVAADLAPVFVDTPWLDIPPNEEGQANLLRGLETMPPAAFDEALRRLEPSVKIDVMPTGPRGLPSAAIEDPKQFLLRVMNDETVPLALRIEAARALLQRGG